MTVIYFFLILSLLIFVHEGGHFWLAKKAGVKVEEFGFGIPPRIWSKKIGETVYSINLFPFGGFVRLFGEDNQVKRDQDRSFLGKGKKTRIAILLAGIMMNFVLGATCFFVVYSVLGIPEKTDQVKIVTVMPDSPASLAGLTVGDHLLTANGEKITSNEEFVDLVEKNSGQTIILAIDRDINPCLTDDFNKERVDEENFSFCQDGQLLAQVLVRSNPPEGEGATGVVISQTENRFYPFYEMISKAIYNGFKETAYWTWEMVMALSAMAKQILGGQGLPTGVSGPVGIYQATEQVAQSGWLALVQFTGILSINLAIFNLIPFPALDGGRVAFVFLEKFIGRKKREKIELVANQIGMLLIIGFLVLVTVNDIKNLGGSNL
jgi:regulator of sigma E protease